MNKQVIDALHVLLHCAKKDTEYETQKEQFDIVYEYIKQLEEIKNQKYIMSISCHGECHICEHYKKIYLLEQKMEEIEKQNYNDYTREQDGNEVKYSILKELKELLESEE